jgi:PD-(D/E)XK nuclease superfamily
MIEIRDDIGTLSPFLPGTQIQVAWDSTSLGWLKSCPRLYQYIMIEGWSPSGESVHLRFGQEYHHALQDYDLLRASGIKHNDAVHDTVRELLVRTSDFDPDHKVKTRNSLVRSVIWYLDQFQREQTTTHILANGKPAVELSFRFELEWGPASADKGWVGNETEKHNLGQPYILCGHIDRVVSFNGDLFVLDHKTTTSAPGEWFYSQFTPDNQMSLYSFAGQIVLNAPVRGVIIDAAQIKEDESAFGRGFTYRTPAQIAEWVQDLRYWLTLAEQYATANYWPMNDKSCGHYRSEREERTGCPFREICGKDPSVRETFLKTQFTKLKEDEKWNPLRSR